MRGSDPTYTSVFFVGGVVGLRSSPLEFVVVAATFSAFSPPTSQLRMNRSFPHMHRRTLAISLAISLLSANAVVACSLLYPADAEPCAVDGDCTRRGAAFAGFTCAANLCVAPSDATVDAGTDADAGEDPFACGKLPPVDPDPTKPVDLGMTFVDFSGGEAAKGIEARICANTDPTCASPRTKSGNPPSTLDAGVNDAGVGGGTGWFFPTADGLVQASVETGFVGFFEVRGGGFVPTIRYISPPLRKSSTDGLQIMLRGGDIGLLAALGVGRNYDPSKGLVFTVVYDCIGNPLPNIRFTASVSDPDMAAFYIYNTAPTAAETKTESTGRGGFLNVPPGFVDFTASYADTGKVLGTTRAIIRGGYATTVLLRPTQ